MLHFHVWGIMQTIQIIITDNRDGTTLGCTTTAPEVLLLKLLETEKSQVC